MPRRCARPAPLGRLFGARIVAGLLVGLGIIALIFRGLLAVRYSLIDEVVVLEAPVPGSLASAARSSHGARDS